MAEYSPSTHIPDKNLYRKEQLECLSEEDTSVFKNKQNNN